MSLSILHEWIKTPDVSQAVFEPPPENWRRPPGRPRSMTCLRCILWCMRLEIECKIGLCDGDWCPCTALRVCWVQKICMHFNAAVHIGVGKKFKFKKFFTHKSYVRSMDFCSAEYTVDWDCWNFTYGAKLYIGWLWRNFEPYLHCVSKKQDTKFLPITSPNVNRFSKFFHWQTQW